ncbi:MAG: arylesterase [Bacteroidota bacterium]
MKPLFFGLFLTLFLACGGDATSAEAETIETPTSKMVTKVPRAEQQATTEKQTIVFFGNSLTAAYGLDPSQGFVGLIRERIDSLGLNYKVVNAGLSGETSAGGNSRIDWILRQKIDVFVLELGANDGLRGTSTEETYKNLDAIIDKVKAKYPTAKIVICAMEALPNMGEKFRTDFRAVFDKLAKENNATLIPFFLNNVGGVPELNQADGIHPTARGHQIVAENIWEVLEDVL